MSKISDEKSLDLGYITEKSEEYDEISRFFKKHIERSISSDKVKELIPAIHPRTVFQIEKPIKKISSLFYVNCIHEHLYRNYGIFKHNYMKDQVLEYFDFIKPGYKIQFLPYSQAIRIHIYLPPSETIQNIESRITINKEYRKLHKKSELEFCHDDNQNYVKYYFEENYQKLNSWGMDTVNQFLKNLDILVNSVYN